MKDIGQVLMVVLLSMGLGTELKTSFKHYHPNDY